MESHPLAVWMQFIFVQKKDERSKSVSAVVVAELISAMLAASAVASSLAKM